MVTKKAITSATTKSRKSKTEDRELDAVWRKFLRSKPLLPKDSCHAIEKEEQTGATGVARRVTLRAAEFTFKFHLDAANKDRDGAVVIATALLMARDWKERLKLHLHLAEAQSLRLELALMEREDMNAVIAEAESGRVVSHG